MILNHVLATVILATLLQDNRDLMDSNYYRTDQEVADDSSKHLGMVAAAVVENVPIVPYVVVAEEGVVLLVPCPWKVAVGVLTKLCWKCHGHR